MTRRSLLGRIDDAAPVDAIEVAEVAQAFGYVVVANRRYTDLFECGQRTAASTWRPGS